VGHKFVVIGQKKSQLKFEEPHGIDFGLVKNQDKEKSQGYKTLSYTRYFSRRHYKISRVARRPSAGVAVKQCRLVAKATGFTTARRQAYNYLALSPVIVIRFAYNK